MPREGHSSVTVSDEVFEVLNERRPDDETWDEFLEKAARMANPYPNGMEGQLRAHEQTRSHLEYVDCRDIDGSGNGEYEIYYWSQGQQFLLLPYPQIADRERDGDDD